MLFFKRVIFISLFFLTACGFSPVYTDKNHSKLLGQIGIQEPNTENDFIFYSHLIDRFGEMGDKYILNYTISTVKADKALNFDGTVHRIEISGSVSFNLRDLENGIELLSDKEEGGSQNGEDHSEPRQGAQGSGAQGQTGYVASVPPRIC